MIYDLGAVGRIPLGEGRQFRIGGVDIAVFRTREGGVFVTQAYCPHKQGPLADGVVGAGTVICPLHGSRFDLRTGCEVRRACAPLATFAVSVSPHGHILLDLDRRAYGGSTRAAS
jgi:nitrite reductase (NADH) small subunit